MPVRCPVHDYAGSISFNFAEWLDWFCKFDTRRCFEIYLADRNSDPAQNPSNSAGGDETRSSLPFAECNMMLSQYLGLDHLRWVPVPANTATLHTIHYTIHCIRYTQNSPTYTICFVLFARVIQHLPTRSYYTRSYHIPHSLTISLVCSTQRRGDVGRGIRVRFRRQWRAGDG
jgi:hypothetical protein